MRSSDSTPDIDLLWQDYKTDTGQDTRSQLIEHYGYLVKATAGRIAERMPDVDRDDLMIAGVSGLLSAMDRYGPGCGVKFQTFAISYIIGAIREMLRKEGKAWKPIWENPEFIQQTYEQNAPAENAPPDGIDSVAVKALSEATDLLRDGILASFEDLPSRLAYFIDFREACRRLSEIRSEEQADSWKLITTLLYTSVRSLYAEDLSLQQVDGLLYVIVTLQNKHPHQSDVEVVKLVLESTGFEAGGGNEG